ncbi:olfactory receptor 14A2-like [Perognathus longimembris pacificus]|uniref:olfactory receptor 14A2-like n=1 Tax=Perognathus longimembris pacificus TaxID=214514 RepID=UPI00201922C9|nr:olfactory receptor 14A2-like [Perognathus longimembris pacificus]
MASHSVEKDFLLIQFSDIWQIQIVHGFVFLMIYLETILGNLFIFTIVTMDHCLHTPMNFFLQNLSSLDAGLISVTVLNLILNCRTHRIIISFPVCGSQLFLVVHFAGCELFLLTAISYDRYVAICHPLHYDVIMNKGVYMWIVAASWQFGSLIAVLCSIGTVSLFFCVSRKFPQFFCDVTSLLKISSSTIAENAINTREVKSFLHLCSHLIVITTCVVTAVYTHLKPLPDSPHLVDFLATVSYSVMTPSLNLIIYSLRNKESKASVRKLLWKLPHFKCFGEVIDVSPPSRNPKKHLLSFIEV